MSVTVIDGDILTFRRGYLAHQVNHLGVMGAGLAKQIASQYPSVINPYRQFCIKHGWDLIKTLGLVHFWQVDDTPLFIANVFGQKCVSGAFIQQTDYSALFRGLYTVKAWAMYHKDVLPVAIPWGMGCGLAGGDWDWVYNRIIVELFANDSLPELFIYRMQ